MQYNIKDLINIQLLIYHLLQKQLVMLLYIIFNQNDKQVKYFLFSFEFMYLYVFLNIQLKQCVLLIFVKIVRKYLIITYKNVNEYQQLIQLTSIILQFIVDFILTNNPKQSIKNNHKIITQKTTLKQKMSLKDHLLQSTQYPLIYNPYQNPPNLQKAQQHRKACRVGIDPHHNLNENENDPHKDKDKDKDNDEQNIKLCICCGNTINKQQIPITCSQDQLLFLGVGYPIYFKLFQYFGIILAIVFVISGGGFYLLRTLNCTNNCVYFMQVPILNLDKNGHIISEIPNFIHFIISIIILIISLIAQTRISSQIYLLEKKIISPQQYTILVQNLPQQVLTQQQIKQWSKQKFGIQPILINFSYNISQLQDAFEQRSIQTIRINRLKIKKYQYTKQNEQTNKNLYNQYIKQLQQRIKKYDEIIDHYKFQNINCRKISTVFLTYTEQYHVQQIINKYQQNFINILLGNIFPIITFKNKLLKFQDHTIILHRAPAPRQIIWQNLSFSWFRYYISQLFAFVTMLLVLFVTFKIQLYFTELEYQFRTNSQSEKQQQNNQFLNIIESVSLSITILIVNLLLRMVIKGFVKIKKHYSYSRYQSSFCYYYSLMYIFNTCFMIYIVHLRHKPKQNMKQLSTQSRDIILLYDIHLLLTFSAISDPIYKLIDPFMWIRVLHRKSISSMPKQRNPYTQAYVNKLWQPYQISNVDNFQYICRVLVVTVWFAHAAPFGVLVALVGFVLDYWITKFLLLRVYKRPQNISKRIAVPFVKGLPILALVYLCGVLQYVYKVSDSHNLLSFMFNFLDYIGVIFLIICIIASYFYFQPPPRPLTTQNPYDEIQTKFQSNYQTQNPMYKIKQDIKYSFYKQLKRTTIKQHSKLLQEISQLNRVTSQNSLNKNKKQQLAKVNRKIKRLQTMEYQMKQKSDKKDDDQSSRSSSQSYQD